MKLIQFTPYFPPHVWWVEKVVFDIHNNWNYWKSIVFTSDIWQEKKISDEEMIVYPAFNIVNNFPFPKFWLPDFWKAIKKLQRNIDSDTRIMTHTRFFYSSFMWGIFARWNNVQWLHIEHWSAFVDSGNRVVNLCSKAYDLTLWKYCIKKANRVLAISKAAKVFLQSTYKRVDIDVWYRGVEFEKHSIQKKWDVLFVYIGRLTKLKNVSTLVECYKKWDFTQKLIIIWDGEEKIALESQSKWEDIEFLWSIDNKKIIEFLQKNKCILINPSLQEWLPTTVIEWLLTRNVVIATNVWGTSEISQYEDLQLYQVWGIQSLVNHMKNWLENFDTYSGKSYKDLNEKFAMKNSMENLYNFLK